jgi:hypothetical protein
VGSERAVLADCERLLAVFRGVGIAAAVTLFAVQASAAVAKSAATPRCQEKALSITLTGASPGLSHHGYVIEFKNRGSACTIAGYPGVDALNAQGHRILSAQRAKAGYLGGVTSGPIPTVHLAKGKTASAVLEWIDLGPPCPSAHSLRITPPNAVTSVVLSPASLQSETLCRVRIHPVVPGRTGQRQ